MTCQTPSLLFQTNIAHPKNALLSLQVIWVAVGLVRWVPAETRGMAVVWVGLVLYVMMMRRLVIRGDDTECCYAATGIDDGCR